MNRATHIYIALFLILGITLFSSRDTYAQKSGAKQPKENVLNYGFQHPQKWDGTKFTKQRTFLGNSYFSASFGADEIWGMSDLLGDSAKGIGVGISFGHWLAPTYGVEMRLGYGVLPYADWGDDDYTPEVLKYSSLGFNYMFNFTSYALKRETSARWDLIGLTGIEFRKQEKLSLGINTGMRIKYNASTKVGIYIEPSIAIFDNNLDNESENNLSVHVKPSISAGVSIRLNSNKNSKKHLNRDTHIAFEPISDSVHQKNIEVIHSVQNIDVTGFSVKTNLLHWMLLAPNISVEYGFNSKWSIGGTMSAAWWDNEDSHSYYQFALYEVEGRRYFGGTKRHHIGAYVQGGYYDLMDSEIGKFGSFTGMGLSYGYMLPLGDQFLLDFEIGMGYMTTEYDEYKFLKYSKIYDYIITKSSSTFVPSKFGVTLVWKFNKLSKRGGSR